MAANPSLPVIQELASVALSGTDNITINLPKGGDPQEILLSFAVKYAAVAGTSGIQATFQYSVDGSTFVNSAANSVTIAPAAGVIGLGVAKLLFGNHPGKLDPISYPAAIKVQLTNLDGTNAAIVAVASQVMSHKL